MLLRLTLSMWQSGPCLNIKTVFPRYGNSHVKDKTVAHVTSNQKPCYSEIRVYIAMWLIWSTRYVMVGWHGLFLNWLYNTALGVMAMAFGTCNSIFPSLPTIINTFRQENMSTILQTTLWNAFSSKKSIFSWFKFHQNSNCSQRPNCFM